MAEPKKLTPVGNITIVTGNYEKDGVKKNRYLTIGTLFKRNEGPGLTIKLDALPPSNDQGQIWMSVYAIQRGDNVEGKENHSSAIDDPIDLNEIPF